MDISINMNIDTNDNLCWHLVEIESSTTSILHIKERSQDKGKIWKEHGWLLQGQRDADSSMQEWGTIPL